MCRQADYYIKEMDRCNFSLGEKIQVTWWAFCFLLPGEVVGRKFWVLNEQLSMGKHFRAAYEATRTT